MTSSSPHPMASGGEAGRLLSLLLTNLPLARGQCLVLAYSFQKLVERAKSCVIKPAFALSWRPCEVIGKSALGLQGVRHVRIFPRECRELVIASTSISLHKFHKYFPSLCPDILQVFFAVEKYLLFQPMFAKWKCLLPHRNETIA